MNINNFYFVFLILALFSSCNSDKKNSGNVEVTKPTGGCYNVANEKLIEIVNIVYDDKEVSGSGSRTYMAFSETFDLSITGKKNKTGGYDVAIVAKSTMQGRENITETTYETWNIKEKTMEVVNRNSSHFVGNLAFTKVNCGGSSQKDSTLYDGFLGFTEGYAPVIKNGKYGLVNEKWELVLPCAYRELGNVSDGTVAFYDETVNKYGILEVPENKVLVPAKYVRVTGFSEGYAAVLDDAVGKWAIINRKGEIIIQPKFWSVSFYPSNPYLTLFNEGLANVAVADAKWGYIDTKLENVIPFQYVFAEPFKNGLGRVSDGQNWFFIDKTGKCVKDCP